jgi:octopine/nopaline transport system substrate-binding protein
MQLIRKKLLFFALSASVLTACSSASFAEDKAVLKIATEGAFKPWNFTEPSGKLAGFEIDLAEDLCKRMNRTCEIVAQDWDGIIPALNAGKYDVIMAAMSITDERKKVLDFSVPYVATYHATMLPEAAVGRLAEDTQRYNLSDEKASEAPVRLLAEELKNKTVGVQLASTNGAFLEAYLKNDVTITYYKTVEQLNLDLQSGRIDATIADLTALEAELKKPGFSGYKIAGPVLMGGVFGEGVGAAMRKGDDALKQLFDTAITAAIKDGTVKQLSEKWYGTDISPL